MSVEDSVIKIFISRIKEFKHSDKQFRSVDASSQCNAKLIPAFKPTKMLLPFDLLDILQFPDHSNIQIIQQP